MELTVRRRNRPIGFSVGRFLFLYKLIRNGGFRGESERFYLSVVSREVSRTRAVLNSLVLNSSSDAIEHILDASNRRRECVDFIVHFPESNLHIRAQFSKLLLGRKSILKLRHVRVGNHEQSLAQPIPASAALIPASASASITNAWCCMYFIYCFARMLLRYVSKCFNAMPVPRATQ
jgi:hypothetical protein